jgi:hypothetical protein
MKNPDVAIDAVLGKNIKRIQVLGDPLEVITNCMRGIIRAAPGHVLLGGDFSAIESRVLAWLTDETWKVENYRRFDRSGDPELEPYCVTATRLLGRKITPEDKAGRTIGKVADLALGFGGALGAWRRFYPDDERNDDEIKRNIDAWRRAHPNIVRFWRRLENAIRICVSTGRDTSAGKIGCKLENETLNLILPSGHRIAYPQARLGPGKFDNTLQVYFKDNAKGAWKETRGWYGTFTENVVQGTARDLLAAALLRLAAAGFKPVLHVHDEAVCEERKDTDRAEEFLRLMTAAPDWAEGLPIGAKTWRGERYTKSETEEIPRPAELSEPAMYEPKFEDPTEDLFKENPNSSPEPSSISNSSSIAINDVADDVDCETIGDDGRVVLDISLGEGSLHMNPTGMFAAGTAPEIEPNVSPPGMPPQDNEQGDSNRNDGGNGRGRYEEQEPRTAAGHSHGDNTILSNYAAGEDRRGSTTDIYLYTDERGNPWLRVFRTSAHTFPKQHRENGRWVAGWPVPEPVYPFRLKECLETPADAPVVVCEGEKDCLTAVALGFVPQPITAAQENGHVRMPNGSEAGARPSSARTKM